MLSLHNLGDVAGHEFHGNQWTEGGGVSARDHYKTSKGTDAAANAQIVKENGVKVKATDAQRPALEEALAHVITDSKASADLLKNKTVEVKDLGHKHGTMKSSLYVDSKTLEQEGPGFVAAVIYHELQHSVLTKQGVPSGQQESRVRFTTHVWAGVKAGGMATTNPKAAKGFERASKQSRNAEARQMLSFPLPPERAARVLVGALRYLGDLPGHEFHGNQYTTGFHGTSEAAASTILKEGMRPSAIHDHVWFTESMSEAQHYGHMAAKKVGSKAVVLEVKIPKTEEVTSVPMYGFKRDEPSYNRLAYAGRVKPEWIRVHSKLSEDGWRSLRTAGDVPGHEFHGNQYVEKGAGDSERQHGEVVAQSKYGEIKVVRGHSEPGKFDRKGDVRYIAYRKNGEGVGTFKKIDSAKDALRTPANKEMFQSGYKSPDVKWRHLGDLPGHEFHGNQWTAGGAGPRQGFLSPSGREHSGDYGLADHTAQAQKIFKDKKATIQQALDKGLVRFFVSHEGEIGLNFNKDNSQAARAALDFVRKNYDKDLVEKIWLDIEGSKELSGGYTDVGKLNRAIREAGKLKTLGDVAGHEFHGNQWTTGGATEWKKGDDAQHGQSLNGVPFSPVEGTPDFSQSVAPHLKEPELQIPKGKHVSAGVVVTEPDGRVWVVEPHKRFGGYRNTFPKGTVDPGESLQLTAAREVFEETGLVAKITGHLTDVERTTSVARFYTGVRVGGAPWAAGKETHAVKLIPIEGKGTEHTLKNVFGRTTSDHKVLESLRQHYRSRNLGDVAGHDFHGNQWTTGSGGEAIVYHGTTRDRVEAIKKQGLDAGKSGNIYAESQRGHVYVASNPHEALYWARETAALANPKNPPDVALFEIHVPKEYARKLKADTGPENSTDTFKFKGSIKPEWIKSTRVGRIVQGMPLDPDRLKHLAENETETLYVAVLFSNDQPLKTAGDVEGHPFHGNQWTTGLTSKSDDELKTLLNEVRARRDSLQLKSRQEKTKASWKEDWHKTNEAANAVSAEFRRRYKPRNAGDVEGHPFHGNQWTGGEGGGSWPEGMSKVGEATGSNPGGLYKDASGQKWYVKNYSDPKQAAGEHVANAVYHAVGVRAPESVLGDSGKYASKWQSDAGATLAKTGLTKENADAVLDGFAADVFLSNWDAVGTGFDNVLVKGGQVTRIDQGGTLLHRAQGALKPDAVLHQIGEWKTLNDPGMNSYYSRIFKTAGVKDGDALGERAVKQIDRIVSARPKGGWTEFVAKVAPGMGKAYSEKVGKILDERQALLEKKRDELKAKLKTGAAARDFRFLYNPDQPRVPAGGPGGGEFAGGNTEGGKGKKAPKAPPVSMESKHAAYADVKSGKTFKETAAKHGMTQGQLAGHVWKVDQAKKKVEEGLEEKQAAASVVKAAPPAPITVEKSWSAMSQDEKLSKATAEGYVWKEKSNSSHGNHAWYDKEGQQVSAFGPKETYREKLDTINHGAGIQAKVPDVSAVATGAWPISDDKERSLSSSYQTKMASYNSAWSKNLSTDERNAIEHYTGSGYSELNSALREGGGLSGYQKSTSDRLNSSIDKAPKPPPPDLVWRGLSSSNAAGLFANLKAGDTMTLKGFQSSTVKPAFAHQWASGTKMLFEIKPSKGAYVKLLSSHAHEYEYLLPHGKQYVVRGVTHVKFEGVTQKVRVLQLEMHG